MQQDNFKTYSFSGVESMLFLQTLFILSEWKVNRKSPLPLDISESGRVPESFGKRVAVNFQLGYLETQKRATQHEYSVKVQQRTNH